MQKLKMTLCLPIKKRVNGVENTLADKHLVRNSKAIIRAVNEVTQSYHAQSTVVLHIKIEAITNASLLSLSNSLTLRAHRASCG